MELAQVRHRFLGFVGGLWFGACVLGAPRVAADGSFDMVLAGALAVVFGFAIACIVAATDKGVAARSEVLCLASALPLWLSARIGLGLLMPFEWQAILVPLALLLIALPFALVVLTVRAPQAIASPGV